jgi:flagellar hook-associated protein 2
MASVSSIGIGSNLGLSELLANLEKSERVPLTLLENQATSYQAKLSAFGTLKSVLSAYQAAAKKLADASTFGAAKTVVGTPDVLTATASSTAVPGSYSVNVSSLAQAQSIVGKNVASQTAAIGTGTITFEFGSRQGFNETTGAYTDPLGFTPDAARTKTVTIAAGDNSLQGVRDAVNKANIGVTASIVNDGSGTPYRLVFTSNTTGEASSMRISSSDAALGDVVAFDPTVAVQPSGSQETIRATNAKLKINGIDIVSQSNTVADAAQGVTLTLNKLGTTSLSVSRDTDAMKSAIQGFVTAYNNIQSTAKSLSNFDTDSETSAALNGDATLRGIQTKLRAMLNVPQSDGNGGAIMLSDIGVSFTKDGTLTVNDTKLDKALKENLGGVTAMFSSTTGTGGYGKQITDVIDGMNATEGVLSVATDGITQSLKDLEDKYDATEARIETTIARYRTQFTQLDILVNQMTQTSNYLTQQFASLGNQSSSK